MNAIDANNERPTLSRHELQALNQNIDSIQRKLDSLLPGRPIGAFNNNQGEEDEANASKQNSRITEEPRQ